MCVYIDKSFNLIAILSRTRSRYYFRILNSKLYINQNSTNDRFYSADQIFLDSMSKKEIMDVEVRSAWRGYSVAIAAFTRPCISATSGRRTGSHDGTPLPRKAWLSLLRLKTSSRVPDLAVLDKPSVTGRPPSVVVPVPLIPHVQHCQVIGL